MNKDSSVHLIYNIWSEWSRITDPDPDHPKGTHPIGLLHKKLQVKYWKQWDLWLKQAYNFLNQLPIVAY